MSNPIDNGGPAFPQDGSGYVGVAPQGMSLRDWFAGQALPACHRAAFEYAKMSRGESMSDADIAKRCYDFADAMLLVRKETK